MDYVLGFMFDSERRRVLLVEKSSPEWQRGKINGVGGKQERNETPIAAMVREFGEEVAIQTDESDWTWCLTLHGKDWNVQVFKAEGPIGLARQTSTKDKPVRCAIDALPAEVIPNLRWIIPFLLDREDIEGAVFYPSLTKGDDANVSQH